MSDFEDYGSEARTASTFDQDTDEYHGVTLQDINEVLGFIDQDRSKNKEAVEDTSDESTKPSSSKSVFTFALQSDVMATLALARDLEELHSDDMDSMDDYSDDLPFWNDGALQAPCTVPSADAPLSPVR